MTAALHKSLDEMVAAIAAEQAALAKYIDTLRTFARKMVADPRDPVVLDVSVPTHLRYPRQ